MMAMLRSTLHMAFMFVTVIPYTLLILLARLLGAKGNVRYAFAQKWLTLSIEAARVIMGIRYQVQGQEGVFVGDDVVRPHLLTTAIGHGAIAADGIDRFLQNEALDKRPKIDVHTFDLKRKMLEKGLVSGEVHEPIRGTDKNAAAIHNFDNRSDRYVISHKELFLGHFPYISRNRRSVTTLTAEQALNNFEERLQPLLEAQVVAEAKRCMSCGQCFECDN